MDYRLIMALLNLLSVFNFHFKNIRALSPFTSYLHSLTLCLLSKEKRHPIPTCRTNHLGILLSVYFQTMQPPPYTNPVRSPPCSRASVRSSFASLSASGDRKGVYSLHFLVELSLFLRHRGGYVDTSIPHDLYKLRVLSQCLK